MALFWPLISSLDWCFPLFLIKALMLRGMHPTLCSCYHPNFGGRNAFCFPECNCAILIFTSYSNFKVLCELSRISPHAVVTWKRDETEGLLKMWKKETQGHSLVEVTIATPSEEACCVVRVILFLLCCCKAYVCSFSTFLIKSWWSKRKWTQLALTKF